MGSRYESRVAHGRLDSRAGKSWKDLSTLQTDEKPSCDPEEEIRISKKKIKGVFENLKFLVDKDGGFPREH